MLTLPTCSRELRCRRWSFTAVMMRGYHLMKAARSQPAFRARRSVALESRNHALLEGEPAWQKFLDETEAFLAS